ncbi:hypothetical protein FoTM2_013396 [Fusarium oxysporum f. sp. vasinfectum]|nr:hypothetical protein FoTM2_013396 [Fusarium oxysporum f. sp. vasinfectum]
MPPRQNPGCLWTLRLQPSTPRSAIINEIREIGRQNRQARAFTNSINNALSSHVVLFEHDKARHPGVVLEVALTQDPDELRRIARRYIYHTDGQIKVVLGIDLNEDKESTISVWKPTFSPAQNDDGVDMDIEQVAQLQPFRDANKNPVNGALTLHLHDFAPDNLCQGCPNTAFLISYHDMSDMMAKAERRKLLREQKEVPKPLIRVVKKRRYSESSEGQMAEENEKRYSDEADDANDKEDRDDGAYEPPKSLEKISFVPRKKRGQGAGWGDGS